MDSRRTPQRVFLAHPLDQITQAVMDYRPALPYFGISNAKTFEAGAVPSQDGLRLHHLGQIEQIGPNPRDPYQQRPVTTAADEAAPASRRC